MECRPYFVNKLKKVYICPVCNEVMTEPFLFSSCDHSSCKSCLQQLLRDRQPCPVDGINIVEEECEVDTELQQRIAKLQVQCANRNIGCVWQGTYNQFQRHLSDECKFQSIQCPHNCGERINDCSLDDHVQNHCQYRIIRCQFCENRIEARNMESHWDQCDEFPVQCPIDHECDEVPRGKLQEHIDSQCQYVIVDCPFQKDGCNYRAERGSMKKHFRKDAINHLILLKSLLDRQRDKVAQQHEIIAEQCKKIMELKKSMDTSYVWRINKFSQKLDNARHSKSHSILISDPFYSHRHGYKLCALMYPNGDGNGKSTHVSIFVHLLKGEYDGVLSWPYEHKTTFELVDQSDNVSDRENISYSIIPEYTAANAKFFSRPENDANLSFGSSTFVSHKVLQDRRYIKDDTFYVKIVLQRNISH
ncbi:TNF receptor-associated factor 4 [Trichoplax sp. H2]|nr:TNF receptor-associated factor 4 [Trichoplax sp. H2]|eukprot:RDD40711.1 TNF receptor-associated factor 4 [Trichoplax sp. H2]